MKREVVIVSAIRTPIGNYNGAFASLTAVDLGVAAVNGAILKAGIKKDIVDEIILGNVLQAGCGQGPARQVCIKSGFPVSVPAFSINMLCGSGLKAVIQGYQSIACGDTDIIVAGGMESMSNAAYCLDKARFGYRMGNGVIYDTMLKDGLIDAFSGEHMGVTAEEVARRYDISAIEQNEFAYNSQSKAVNAIENNLFADEIAPVEVNNRKGKFTVLQDEFPRRDVTMSGLNNLKPAFQKDGTVTAGNSSGLNDGAAAVVLMSKNKAAELNIKPLAVIKGHATAGVEPAVMGTGPIPAVKKALKMAEIDLHSIDLIESNEAFAAQSIAVARGLNFEMSKVNLHGGAIALGHPIGASGARILTTLVHGLKRYGKKNGLATLCVGGGMGVAVVVQAID